ncbi:hypothetical protein [Candidatus Lokiarchaeum ossiferum]|uniref:hypothetical protein n=1 Tax=Candidatus Lokiarchaeum ossiferum TaxID=2951803 RepID=UPI00352CE94C
MNFNVRRHASDNNIFYFAKELDINNHRIKTPIPMMHHSLTSAVIPSEVENRAFEMWKSFDINKIQNAAIDNGQARYIGNSVSDVGNSVNSSDFKILFTGVKNFQTNPFRQLDHGLRQILMDNAYRFTDFVTFPILSKISHSSTPHLLMDRYLAYIQDCYEISETLNNKPIMGIISPVPIHFIPKIVDKYLSLGVDCFCFDFEGSGLNSYYAHYQALLRQLFMYDRTEFGKKVKYAINMKLPSNTNRNGPFPAEDLLIPAIGVDFLGINHIAGGSSPKKTTKKSSQRSNRPTRVSSRINLVDTNVYSYRRISDISEFHENFSEPLITPNFSDFTTVNANQKRQFSRNFNYISRNLEMSGIHDQIMNNESISRGILNKPGLDNSRKRIIRSIKSSVQSPGIEAYFN